MLNVKANGNISTLGIPTVAASVETGNLTGTTGTDSMTLTGAQLDAIIIGAGTINLEEATGDNDTINLTTTSSKLNTLGADTATDRIQGVEAISALPANASGVT